MRFLAPAILALLLSVVGIVPGVAQERPSRTRIPIAMNNGREERGTGVSVLDRPAYLRVERVSLEKSLEILHLMSGVDLVFSPSLLPTNHTVACSCDHLSVRQALEVLLEGTHLSYTDVDGHVVISARHEPIPALPALQDISIAPRPLLASLELTRAIVTGSVQSTRSEPTRGQEASVMGVVLEEGSLRPLVGAQVQLVGSDRAAITDLRGRFLILNVAGREVTVEATMLGYRSVTQTVRVGDADTQILLRQEAIPLEQIVVTGTPGGTRFRAVGNAVSTVDAGDLVDLAPQPDMQQLLSSRVPGLRLLKSQGEVGTGGVMHIRGIGSLSLPNEPLLYVDGIRVDNNPAAGGGKGRGAAFYENSPASRINDLDPEQIESIEVIKGPAAATLYGTEASRGVIQIITKKGRPGNSRFHFTMKQGANWLRDPPGTFPSVYGKDPKTGETVRFNVLESEKAQGRSPFSAGHPQSYQLEADGGSDALRFYFSGGFDRDEGVQSINWQNNGNVRANLTFQPVEQLEIQANLGLLRSKNRIGSTQQAITADIVWTTPATKDTRTRGYTWVTPEQRNDIEAFENLDRATFGLETRHHPFSWLRHRLILGGDVSNQKTSKLYPRRADPTSVISFLNPLGRKEVHNTRTTYGTFDYSATGTYQPTSALSFATSVGVQYFLKQIEESGAIGITFPAPGVETVSGAALRFGVEDFLENKTLGAYVQEQIGWRDRMFLTGAVRGDDNSAFGSDFDVVVYPKLSGTWILSDEPFWNVPFVSTLKLRAAWGKAGRQPDVFAAARLYEASVGAQGVATFTPGNLGNPNLKPEVGEELEVGFDAGMVGDRVKLEFTFYDQRTTDGIVARPALPSLGFPGTQFVNLGEVSNRGIELRVDAGMVDHRNVRFDLGLALSTNENELVSLGGLPPVSLSATQLHVEGFAVGGIFLRKVVSAEFDGKGNVVNLLCEGGPDLGPGGPPVPCEQAGRVFWGRPTPSWEGSVSGTLRLFNNLRLSALVDYTGGHKLVSGDIGGQHGIFNNSKVAVERSEPVVEAYRKLGHWYQLGVFDAGYAKLRDVSMNYTFPSRLARKIGASRASITVSGRNLATVWVAQQGIHGVKIMDPENRWIDPNGRGLQAYLQSLLPQFTQFLTTLRVSF